MVHTKLGEPTRELAIALLCALSLAVLASDARAAQPAVGLATAGGFAVLGGATVTNTGPTVINGDLGVFPGTSITGLPPGVVNGAVHAADAVASGAQASATTAYDGAAGRIPAAALPGTLGGLLPTPGVYRSVSSLGLAGDVTLTPRATPTRSSCSRWARRSRPRRAAASS